SMGDENFLSGKVNAIDFTSKEVYPPQHLADRIHDGGEIQVAGRNLVQHGREQEEVVAIDQHDLYTVPSELLLQLHRHSHAGKASAENDNTRRSCVFHLVTSIVC